MTAPYTDSFLAGRSAQSLVSARLILGALFGSFRPASVVDVGCGVGAWLRAARELGVTDILGLGDDRVDRAALMIEASAFVPVDLENASLGSVACLAEGRRFDLVISVDIAEHLSLARAESFVEDMTRLGDAVLFAAAIPFQGGAHHVNAQWPDFWASLFRGCGFDCLDPIRPLIWAREDVDWRYAQNALVFVRHGSAVAEQLRATPVTAPPSLALVHPGNYLAQVLQVQAKAAALQAESARLRTVHADAAALRRELEEQLARIQQALCHTVAETRERLAQHSAMEVAASALAGRLAELEGAHAVRLAKRYYRIFSLPVIGRPLRLARRALGSALRLTGYRRR